MDSEPAATLRVIGTASCASAPDRVQIRLAAEHTADGAPQALDGASASSASLVAAVKHAGVADSDIQTMGMSLDRGWDPQQSVPRGYVARHQFTIYAAMPLSGAVIAAAADAGGDDFRIESVNLVLSDPDPLRRRAQRDAFDDAHNQAAELARVAGRELGAALSVDTATGREPILPKAGLVLDRGGFPPALEGGEFAVSASVVVVYQLV